MKLHNKNTGEIKEGVEISIWLDHEGTLKFRSLAELNEEWEDYKPKEPLIKDKNIRKAVRAWAEVESIPSEETVFYNGVEYSFGWYHSVIEFSKPIQHLREAEYTIAELCGDED